MKDNNVPRNDRLRRRISNLKSKLIGLEPIPYGGKNPYHYCAACNRSMIEVSYAGHYKGCLLVGIQNEIKYYESLLE